jgi:hypothetical protein
MINKYINMNAGIVQQNFNKTHVATIDFQKRQLGVTLYKLQANVDSAGTYQSEYLQQLEETSSRLENELLDV